MIFLKALSNVIFLGVVEAAIRRPTENQQRAPQIPLIIPVFGFPMDMEIKAWVYDNSAPGEVRQTRAALNFYCPENEVNANPNLDFGTNIVLGSYEFRKSAPNRPSSTLMLANTPTPDFDGVYPFCLKSIDEHVTFLSLLLNKFNNKMISFWWDSTTPLYGGEHSSTPIAELAIGGMNPARYFDDSQVKFKAYAVNNDQLIDNYWESVLALYISVGNNQLSVPKDVIFDLSTVSSIPSDVYEALTKQLKVEMRYAIGLLKGMPKDATQHIMGFHNFNEPIVEFDCKFAPKLQPLQVGRLTIEPQMMYRHISSEKCKLTIQRNENPHTDRRLKIGIDLIRQFYFSIRFGQATGDYLYFGTRKAGEAPSTQ